MCNNLKCFHIFFLLTAAFGFSACDRSINPFEDDQGIYSVYGALQVGNEQNIIRVRNLAEPFSSDTAFPFDATVTFTDLQTGKTTQLRDSIVDFEVGRTHNFVLEEDLELRSQYQITVERSDGETVTSTATTPGLTEVTFFPQQFVFCETPIEFRFDYVENSEFVEMDIGAFYQSDLHWAQMDLVGQIEYDPQLDVHKVTMSPRNLLVEIFTPVLPDNPYFDPYMLFPTVTCNQLDSNQILIRYRHFGSEWDIGRPIKEGLIDIESGDVENGLGFFGAYRVDSFTVQLTEEEEEE